ncbi:AbiJ-related protein [Paraburkholderia xenovorans]|uniref:AbiJ-related protein n=1 Tax=Paraburkholderia xenovorans TaxID=36873 RepID=UPI0038B83AE5
MKISQLTRRDLIDAIAAERLDWSGRLEESEILSRIYDLESLPSTDGRFKDAAGDIWQHRVNNFDWDEDWVFYDSRFGLMNGDDEIFLRFLCETLHPVVRADATEADRMCQLFNQILQADGFEVDPQKRTPILLKRRCRNGQASYPVPGGIPGTDGRAGKCRANTRGAGRGVRADRADHLQLGGTGRSRCGRAP